MIPYSLGVSSANFSAKENLMDPNQLILFFLCTYQTNSVILHMAGMFLFAGLSTDNVFHQSDVPSLGGCHGYPVSYIDDSFIQRPHNKLATFLTEFTQKSTHVITHHFLLLVPVQRKIITPPYLSLGGKILQGELKYFTLLCKILTPHFTVELWIIYLSIIHL